MRGLYLKTIGCIFLFLLSSIAYSQGESTKYEGALAYSPRLDVDLYQERIPNFQIANTQKTLSEIRESYVPNSEVLFPDNVYILDDFDKDQLIDQFNDSLASLGEVPRDQFQYVYSHLPVNELYLGKAFLNGKIHPIVASFKIHKFTDGRTKETLVLKQEFIVQDTKVGNYEDRHNILTAWRDENLQMGHYQINRVDRDYSSDPSRSFYKDDYFKIFPSSLDGECFFIARIGNLGYEMFGYICPSFCNH
jgi:hypothetical protein